MDTLETKCHPLARKEKGQQMMASLHQSDQPFDIPGNFKAKQRRTRFDNSKMVFPKPTDSKSKKSKIYQTHYQTNFKRSQDVRPTSPRPCSPTRRNNPHPSQNFLNWRIPTRVFDYGKEREANLMHLSLNHQDTFQRFNNDYTGIRHQEPNAGVDPKMLMSELTKSFGATSLRDRERLDDCKRKKKERTAGTKLPSLLRRSWSPDGSSTDKLFGTQSPFSHAKRKPLPAPEAKQDFTPLFVKPEFEQFFRSWYDAVSPTEKETVQEVMNKADDTYIKETLATALQPTAIQAIETWLAEANEEERKVALGFIQALLIASENQLASGESEEPHKSNPFSYLDNLPRPNNPPIPGGPLKCGGGGHGVKDHHSHTSHYKACSVCENQKLEQALQALKSMATMPMEVTGITELLNPLHPGVLAQKQFMKDQRMHGRSAMNMPGGRVLNRPRACVVTCIANRGALFANTKQDQKKHFTIHPEWN